MVKRLAGMIGSFTTALSIGPNPNAGASFPVTESDATAGSAGCAARFLLSDSPSRAERGDWATSPKMGRAGEKPGNSNILTHQRECLLFFQYTHPPPVQC